MAKKTGGKYIPTNAISQDIEDKMRQYKFQRSSFERRWYDNNFFDDGFHFRYVSRKTGKIIDESGKNAIGGPRRAIPKASRQIRGVASLLLQLDPYPVVYPERIKPVAKFVLGPNGQMIENAMYEQYLAELKRAKDVAKKKGWWVEDEWADHDMDEKLVHLIILASKHGVSFLQAWDDENGVSRSRVFDAFDIYLNGTLSSIYDCPEIIKAVPTDIEKIKTDDRFDEAQRMKISPDNKYASSEIKEAYMNTRFGGADEPMKTIILKETFRKEFITDDNIPHIKASNADALVGKNKGDTIIRHIYSTSNGWLLDEYTDMEEYPFVDFRFEPGPIYQTPLIERFIPANKSLDIAVSRVEGFANTMVTGVYQKRKGENFKISNIPGGQIIEYEQLPLTQMQPSSVPAFMFKFINLLEEIIQEQGASTAALGSLPEGVKSGVAIESLKSAEYANLIIPTTMFKKTVKRIAKRLIELGAQTLFEPTEVARDDGKDAQYFDVIGEEGVKAYKEALLDVPGDAIVIKKDDNVRIEIESGLGYTISGKKETMQQIANYMLQLAEVGMVSKEQVQVIVNRFLEIFQFGSTAEFIDALESGEVQGNEDQMEQMKIAVLEVLSDVGLVGDEADQKTIDATKVGMLEVANDLGE